MTGESSAREVGVVTGEKVDVKVWESLWASLARDSERMRRERAIPYERAVVSAIDRWYCARER